MAIGNIRTESDLRRFVEESVARIPLNQVDRLPGELAQRGRTRAGLDEAFIPEGATASEEVTVTHGLPELPSAVDLTILRAVGGSVFSGRVTELTEDTLKFLINVSPAVGVGGTTVNVLWSVTGGNGF